MRTFPTAVATVFASALALTAAHRASAFCGFYVSGADNKLFADATQVVLMRDGTRTVLSMQNDYKGPPEKFALVIPVPVVLAKENVKVLPRELFDKVDKLGAPRLVEYWEQNPCPTPVDLLNTGASGGGRGEGIGLGNIGTLGHGAGDLGVQIEAKFEVGEYEIVVLSAKDAAGLEVWLKQENYAIPAGAEPYFKPYVASGMKFFVAKVDVTKLQLKDGRATLSPLRFHYDSDKFTLPVRLGLINSQGKQDLIVSVLAKRQRYEAANYPNAFIPTNLEVQESARGQFGQFYAALFDKAIEAQPKAVITEYAWDAGTCDPCPGPTLNGQDLATLGADVLPEGTTGLRGSNSGPIANVQLGGASVTSGAPPMGLDRTIATLRPRLRRCYAAGLAKNPKLGGKVELRFDLGAGGKVSGVKDLPGGTMPDNDVRDCLRQVVAAGNFPAPDKGTAQVTFPITFTPEPAPSVSPSMGLGSAGFATPYVLTRLHLRYDKDSLGEDLVFRNAEPVAGGREVRGQSKELEKGALPSGANNFQGRYAIRHPWTGPIECKEPMRGVWGGPPAGSAQPSPVAAQKTAFVSRSAPLGTFLTTSGARDLNAAVPSASPGSAGAAASTTAAGSAGAPSPAPAKKGCNASNGPAERGGPGGALLAAFAVLTLSLRRRSKHAGSGSR